MLVQRGQKPGHVSTKVRMVMPLASQQLPGRSTTVRIRLASTHLPNDVQDGHKRDEAQAHGHDDHLGFKTVGADR